jgi:nitroreductase
MTENTLTNVLEERHSGRSFDPSKKVSDKDLNELIKASHIAPSCYNDQPWRFLICSKENDSANFQKIWQALAEGNQKWAGQASHLIVVCSDTLFQRNSKPNRWGSYDSGAAAVFMMLKATELGLLTHQMGGFDEKKIAESFEIPSRYIPMSVMALGYELEKPTEYIRERRPIQEQYFKGEWGAGVQL